MSSMRTRKDLRKTSVCQKRVSDNIVIPPLLTPEWLMVKFCPDINQGVNRFFMNARNFATGGLLLIALFSSAPLYASDYSSMMAQKSANKSIGDAGIKKKLSSEFSRWSGVKYRFGGTTMKGIDCSALVQKIYHSSFFGKASSHLPRTTEQQIKQGVKTKREDLRAGDLVFFQLSPKQKHVGIYIGGKKFIHASTSEGVIISTLDNSYWSERFA